MSARFGLRAIRAQQQMASNMRFAQRRMYQSAAENPANIVQPTQTGLAAFWNSKVGPKTVHFWAPIMKVRLFGVYGKMEALVGLYGCECDMMR
jgi:hypothetical protein